MKKPLILLVAGAPATGKTSFAKFTSLILNFPLICKDELKQLVWEKEQYEKDYIHFNKINGIIAYKMLFYFTEQLMKTNMSFILESNFRSMSIKLLNELIIRYNYNVMTILFETDIEILHKRFLERDQMAERHPGLKTENYYYDINFFKECIVEDCQFNIGKTIKINTNDFNKVSYENIIEQIKIFNDNDDALTK